MTWLIAGLENVLFAHCTYNSSEAYCTYHCGLPDELNKAGLSCPALVFPTLRSYFFIMLTNFIVSSLVPSGILSTFAKFGQMPEVMINPSCTTPKPL